MPTTRALAAFLGTMGLAMPASGDQAGLGVLFVPNRGQAPAEVAYAAPTLGGTWFVDNDGTFGLASGREFIRERVVGAVAVAPIAAMQTPTVFGVAKGPPGQWRENLPSFERVAIPALLEGIDLELRAIGNNVEKRFLIHPQADPGSIQVEIAGVEHAWLAPDGALVLQTAAGLISFSAPVAFQDFDGLIRPVDVNYQLDDLSYGFIVGDYDRTRPLVIDPIIQSTYLGGTRTESARITTQGNNIIVAGRTTSDPIFGLPGPTMDTSDIYVALLSQDLRTLEAVYLFGGAQDESVMEIVVHPINDRVYVLGMTDSTAADGFPVDVGSAQTEHAGNDEGFIAAFSPGVTSLIRATYLGGSLHDVPHKIAVNDVSGSPHRGEIYVGGETNSQDFPGRAGGAQPAVAGVWDAFATRLDADLIDVLQSTYMGGSTGSETYVTMAIGPDGRVYLKGVTNSNDLPATGFQTNFGGYPTDAFVAVFDGSLTGAFTATYLGGNEIEETRYADMIFHPDNGDLYVAGHTEATNFPGASNCTAGSADLFLARISPDLTTLVGATCIGGPSSEHFLDLDLITPSSHPHRGDMYLTGSGAGDTWPEVREGTRGLNSVLVVRVSPSLIYGAGVLFGGSQMELARESTVHWITGDLYLVGQTTSADLPGIENAVQRSLAGTQDVFIARIRDTEGPIQLMQTTYLGGLGSESPSTLSVHPTSAELFVAGQTSSADYPGTEGGAQAAFGGEMDGFVTRIDQTLRAVNEADIDVMPLRLDFPAILDGTAFPLAVTIANVGLAPLDVTSIISSNPDDFELSFIHGEPPCIPLPLSLEPEATCQVLVTFGPAGVVGERFGTLEILSNDADEGRVQVPMSGTSLAGGKPYAALSRDAIEFPTTVVGETSAPETITLSSIGEEDLVVSSVGTSNPEFRVENGLSFPFTLTSGDSVDLELVFAPAEDGARSGLLSVISNESASVGRAAQLSGEGTRFLGPRIEVDPESVDFGDVEHRSTCFGEAGDVGKATVVIRNTGTKPLHVQSMEVVQPDAPLGQPSFGVDLDALSESAVAVPRCGRVDPTIEPGERCYVVVWFWPLEEGRSKATLTIQSDDSERPRVDVPLTGSGDWQSCGSCSVVTPLSPPGLLFLFMLVGFIRRHRPRKRDDA